MPVIPVLVAGVALASGGAAAIGAVIAGTATLATTLTAVAAVGATLGAVGAVTHDKTLSTVGMVLGGVGGIGALAANAGLLGASATTESLFGSASAGAETVTVTPQVWGTDAGLTDAGRAALEGSVATSENDIISSIGSMKIDAAMPNIDFGGGLSSVASGTDVLPAASAAPNQDLGSVGFNKTADAASAAATKPDALAAAKDLGTGATDPNVINAGMGPAPANPTTGMSVKGLDGNTYTFDGKAWTQSQGFFHSLVSSPMGQLGMIQAGGSLISGMFDPLKPAQVEAYNAQAAANRAGANLTAAQTANMAANVPVASRVKAAVTGAPVGTGIINQAPTPAVPVTGAAA
jgi:hypothetical protein